jgi:putative transcriptional regulator
MNRKIDLEPGDCLIAPPFCKDPRFKKSVIYIWEHGASGSAGAVINRPTNHIIGELVSSTEAHIANHIMYWGGPVHTTLVFMLHTNDWKTGRSNNITEDLSVTSDNRMFDMIADDQPNEWRVIFGHANWGPGQLDGELSGIAPWTPNHSWLVLKKPTVEWLFNADTDKMWQEAINACTKQSIDAWI